MAEAVQTTPSQPGGLDDGDLWPHLESLKRACGCMRFELTDREVDVLEQLAEGKSTSAAARCLFVSPQAVTYHVGNLLAKLQCTNRSGLIARAFVLGILQRTWPPKAAPRARHPGPGAMLCPRHLDGAGRRRTLGRVRPQNGPAVGASDADGR